MDTTIARSDRRPVVPGFQPTSLGAAALSLDFPSCVQMITPVDVLVGEVATSAGFDRNSVQDVQIAVHEAIINAIVHGNGRDESRRVRLEVSIGPTGFEVRVQDQGRGFDPSGVPDPLATDNLCKPCGRGILLMRSLMDEVSFRHVANGGTQVMMLKRRAQVAQATTPAHVAAPCA